MTIKHPFENESECASILDEFFFENRTDMVSIHGSVDITKDKEGLEKAKVLLANLTAIIDILEHSELPDNIARPDEPTIVSNPFGM